MFFLSKKYAWGYVAGWAIFLFVLSANPGDGTDWNIFPHSDKVAHVLMYGPLGFFLYFAMQSQPGPFGNAPIAWSWIWGTLYGVSDEVHQYFVPGRFMDGADLIADSIGVGLGIVAFHVLERQWQIE